MRVARTMCHRPFSGVVSIPEVLIECLAGSTGRRLKSLSVGKLFLPLEPLRQPFVPRPWNGQGGKAEASSKYSKELSACCVVVVPRMLFCR
jgi:hypothetical protein